MIFYLIPAHGGQPARLEPTQDLARGACRDRGLRPSEFTDHNVPTDKAGLQSYVNDLLAREYAPAAAVGAPPAAEAPAAAAPAPGEPVMPQWLPADRRAARQQLWSAGQSADAVCEAVEDMDGQALGNVALAVACRFQALGRKAAV